HVRFMVVEALWPRTRGTAATQAGVVSRDPSQRGEPVALESERKGVPAGSGPADLSANGGRQAARGTETRDGEGTTTTGTAPTRPGG
ncbi:MAG: hypothetical protein ACTHQQ_15040, partial [Solirubrobacteraceae bacterium]